MERGYSRATIDIVYAVHASPHTRRSAFIPAVVATMATFAIVAIAATQESKSPATVQTGQQPPIRTGTELVRVDVSVVDKRGTPVTTLTADDFDVREEGVPQPIKSFKLVEVSGEPEPGDDRSLEIRSASHAAAEASRDDVRVFLIFWDEYHIDRFTSTLRAREALSRFVLTAFGPTDLVAFMDPLTPSDAIAFTRNRRLLADTAARLKGRYRVYLPPRSAAEEAHLERPREIERLRAEVTSTALESAVVHLGAMKEGRKSLIVVSEGQGVPDSTQSLERLTRLANDHNTAIYVLDPRGLSAGMASVLGSLAADTGGEFFRSNDLEGSLGRVVKESRAFYLIGYDASASPKDGRFHEIRVRLKRSGYEVKARRGYWAPSVADLTRTRPAALELPKAVAEALAQLTPPLSPRAADVWIGIEPGENLRSRMRLAWTPRGSRQSASRSAISASAVVTGPNGDLFDGPLDERGVTVDVPSGTATVTLTVRDGGGEVIDRLTRTVLVPEASASPLAISSASVFRASTPLDLRALQTSSDPAPFAGREFARTDRLLIRFVVSGPSSPHAKVEARLLNGRGSVSTRLAVSSIAQSRPTESASAPVLRRHEIDLPLTNFVPADWLVSIEASAGEDRAESVVAFRIVR
jgi:VWFA-related protein